MTNRQFARAMFVHLLCFAVCITANFAYAQEQRSEAAEHKPRGNAEYFNIPTRSRVAQRFEMYSPHSVEALRELKEMGITQVILDWPNLHADATRLGLDVVLSNWWNDKTAPAEIDRVLDFAKGVDAKHLRGISVMDEPERNSPDTPFGFYVDLYEKLHPRMLEKLPGARLEISYWGPLARWDQRYYDYFSYLYEAADVMRIMPYPDLHEGPLGEVSLMMLRSREVMKLSEREIPTVVILQTWILPPRNELPTLPELRVMAWQALLGGAETVSFFDHNPQVWNATDGFSAGFAELVRELTATSQRLRDAEIIWTIREDGIFTADLELPHGEKRRVRINTLREPSAGLAALEIREEVLPPETNLNPCPPPVETLVCPPVQRVIPVRPRKHLPLRFRLFRR